MNIPSVEKIVNRYITEHVDYVAIDHNRASIAWKRLSPHFGAIPINKLSGKHVSAYTKKRDASAGTINRELGVLSAALRWANAEGIIDRVIVIKRLPEPEPRKMWLDKEECLRFLEASKRYPHVFLFLSLQWPQVVWKEGVIDFRDKHDRRKRRKNRAVIPISPEMHTLLSGIERDSMYVISNNGRRIRDMRKAWTNILEDCGLEGVTPHVLRHSVATNLVRDGVPIIEVAKLLGHKDSRITERVYAKFAPDYLDNVVSKLTIAA
jgi:integrase